MRFEKEGEIGIQGCLTQTLLSMTLSLKITHLDNIHILVLVDGIVV
jgi:hypothetical protein